MNNIGERVYTQSSINKRMARMSHPCTTIWSDVFKTLPNYPPHPPMPASRHSVQAGHILADYQSQEHSDTSGN